MIDEKGIDDEVLRMILQEIENRNTKLRILSLNNNLIGDKGCEMLASLIPKLTRLEILYLSKSYYYPDY